MAKVYQMSLQHNFSSTSLLPPASPSQTTSAALIFWEGTRQSHFFISNPISLYSSILSRNKIFFQTLLLIIERKNNNTLKHSRQKQVKTFLPNKFDFLCHPPLCQVYNLIIYLYSSLNYPLFSRLSVFFSISLPILSPR